MDWLKALGSFSCGNSKAFLCTVFVDTISFIGVITKGNIKRSPSQDYQLKMVSLQELISDVAPFGHSPVFNLKSWYSMLVLFRMQAVLML